MLSAGPGLLEVPSAAGVQKLNPLLLLRLFLLGCRPKLALKSFPLLTLPKLSTSGLSRSNGSDCRIVRRVGKAGVNMLVAGLLGPGSPKKKLESRVAKVEFASNVVAGLKFGKAIEERRRVCPGNTAWFGIGGTFEESLNGSSPV